jgi:hypothetical protein
MASGMWAQRTGMTQAPERPTVQRERPALLGARIEAEQVIGLGPLNDREGALLGRRARRNVSGVHRDLPEDVKRAGAWESAPDGRRIWRASVESPGAKGIRVRFSKFAVGPGKVWIYSGPGDEHPQGPYSGRGLFGDGEFWSGSVSGETVVIEYQPADPADTGVPFEIESVSHRATAILPKGPFGERPALNGRSSGVAINEGGDRAAACHLDATCYPDWHDTMKSVADIFFEVEEEGQKFQATCTGTLIATSNHSLKPYLLTAGHCISGEAQARTMEALWTYQTEACGAPPPDPRASLKSQTGAHYLASASLDAGDYSLLLLKGVPSGVQFAGWDAGEIGYGAPVTGIHHPMGSWKRILFGHRVGDADVTIDNQQVPASYYYVVALDRGIAQPGSSGSPLFAGPGVVAGTLSYGPSAPGEALCARPDFDIGYGRFSVAYAALKDYLEDLPSAAVMPAATEVVFNGLNGTFADAGKKDVVLTTGSANAVGFTVRSDAPWIQVSAPEKRVSASSPVRLTISVDENLLKRAGSYAGTVSILAGAAAPQYINVRATMNMQISEVEASASAYVVDAAPDGTWPYVLRLRETAGAATRVDLLRIDGTDHSSRIASWFGTARLEAHGTLEAPINAKVISGPVQQYISIGGQDEGSGQRWYRTLAVTLNAAK